MKIARIRSCMIGVMTDSLELTAHAVTEEGANVVVHRKTRRLVSLAQLSRQGTFSIPSFRSSTPGCFASPPPPHSPHPPDRSCSTVLPPTLPTTLHLGRLTTLSIASSTLFSLPKVPKISFTCSSVTLRVKWPTCSRAGSLLLPSCTHRVRRNVQLALNADLVSCKGPRTDINAKNTMSHTQRNALV